MSWQLFLSTMYWQLSANDFDYAPFAQQGRLGKVHQVFGDELNSIIEEMNEVLAA